MITRAISGRTNLKSIISKIFLLLLLLSILLNNKVLAENDGDPVSTIDFELINLKSDRVVFYDKSTKISFQIQIKSSTNDKTIKYYPQSVNYSIKDTDDAKNGKGPIKSGNLLKTEIAELGFNPKLSSYNPLYTFEIDEIFLGNKVNHPLLLSVNIDNNYVLNKKFYISGLPGWTTLIPIFILISAAVFTGNGLLSLLIGLFVSSLFVNRFNPLLAVLRLMDEYIIIPLVSIDNIQIIMFQYFLCGLIGLMQKGGGAMGLTRTIGSFAKNRKSAQWATFIAGIVIFFDGPNMRPISDLMYVSREKLSFIVHVTSSPLACISPISSWIGFQLSLIEQQLNELKIDSEKSFLLFLKLIPRFYFIIHLFVFVFCSILFKRDFGPMLSAERRAFNSHLVVSNPNSDSTEIVNNNRNSASGSESIVSHENETEYKIPKRLINAAVPIASIIIITILSIFLTGYYKLKRGSEEGIPNIKYTVLEIIGKSDTFASLLYSIFVALLILVIMLKIQNIFTFNKAIEVMVEGVKDFVDPLLILVFAWGIGESYKHLKCAEFLASILTNSLDLRLLPSLVFLVGMLISFATGSSWGAMTVMFPLVLPFVYKNSKGMDLFMESMACIFNGAIAGELASPVSSTTLLSSIVCKLPSKHHFKTQLCYIITVCLISLITCIIPVSFKLYSSYIGLFVGIAFVSAFVLMIGVDVENSSKVDIISFGTKKLVKKTKALAGRVVANKNKE